jgi:hypothetical protein
LRATALSLMEPALTYTSLSMSEQQQSNASVQTGGGAPPAYQWSQTGPNYGTYSYTGGWDTVNAWNSYYAQWGQGGAYPAAPVSPAGSIAGTYPQAAYFTQHPWYASTSHITTLPTSTSQHLAPAHTSLGMTSIAGSSVSQTGPPLISPAQGRSYESKPDIYDPSCPTDSSSAPAYLSTTPTVRFQMKASRLPQASFHPSLHEEEATNPSPKPAPKLSSKPFPMFVSSKLSPTSSDACPTLSPASRGAPPTPPPEDSYKGTGAGAEATAGSGASSWPPSLRAYVGRAFSICVEDAERNQMEKLLKAKISAALADNSILQRAWDQEPLPSLQDEVAIVEAPQMGKKKKRLVTANLNSKMEKEKRQKRSLRFKQHQHQATPGRSKLRSRPSLYDASLSTDGEEVNWDALTIRGTSQALEKPYLRLTSAPDPSTVRPEPVLKKSLKMIKSKWRSNPDYLYSCEQLKSIRQDLTVQHIKNKFAIEVYETHARLALENGDLGEFNQCQTQLRQLYEELHIGNIVEFTAYRILYALFANNMIDITGLLSELSPEMREEEAIAHALEVRAAAALNNYHSLFRLYREAPNMGPYVIRLFIDRLRLAALRVMTKAYRPTIPMAWLAKELAFDNLQEAISYVEEKGATFTSKDKQEIDAKAFYTMLITANASESS